MKPLLRLALLAYPQPLRDRYAAEIAEAPLTPFSLLDVLFAGLRERWDNLARDIRHASRALLRTPGATSVAVLALALGVGANVAVYSVVLPVLLEPLPFAEPENLHRMTVMTPGIPGSPAKLQTITLAHHYLDWRDRSARLAAIGAMFGSSLSLTFDDHAELAAVGRATPGLMDMLGLEVNLGRGFVQGDSALDAPNVVLLSERFWRTRFGARQDAVGETLILEDETWEVVGVAPAALNRLIDADLWQPLRLDEPGIRAGGPQMALQVIGRLAQGTTIEGARAELDEILKTNESAPYARLKGGWSDTTPLHAYLVGNAKATLELLWGAVALVLLIACSNVAGVLLVRGIARHGETGVRLALGAGRRSLFRQALTESVLLAALGGSAGVLLAYGGVRVLKANLPNRFPRAEAIGVDAPTLLFALIVTTVVGLLLGLAPAWAALRQSPSDTIRLRTGAATAGQTLSRVQGGLLAIQVAFAAVLLAGAGLLLHSLVRIGQVDIGVHSPDTASVGVTFPRSFPAAPRQAYFRELLDRAEALPGVRSAAVSTMLPLTGFASGAAFRLPNDPALTKEEQRALNSGRMTFFNAVSENYFETVGARLLEGRAIEPADAAAGNVVINRALAEAAYPGESAVGRAVGMAGGDRFFNIVGVVENYRQLTPRWPVSNEIYSHWRAEAANPVSRVSARPAGAGKNLVPLLRQAAIDLHPAALVRDATTQADLLASTTAEDRFRSGLIGLFAVIATMLAGSGIFATVSFTVSRRTREIAIRRALGATAASVCATALRGALVACAAGATAGLTAAYWLRSLTQGMLFEVDALDPATYVAAAAALAMLALVASLAPASKAARLDPAQNLRAD